MKKILIVIALLLLVFLSSCIRIPPTTLPEESTSEKAEVPTPISETNEIMDEDTDWKKDKIKVKFTAHVPDNTPSEDTIYSFAKNTA